MTVRVPQQRGGPAPASVLVVVGTDVHGFDRLLGWVARWYAARRSAWPPGPALTVQYGHSSPPDVPGAVPFLGHDDLQRAMAEATIVVSHGGPATITEARRTGHLPIVVPRDPAYREHVDNHQQLFARRLAAAGMVSLCETEQQLTEALDRGLAEPARFELAADGQAREARAEAVARVGRIVEDLVAQRSRRTAGTRRWLR